MKTAKELIGGVIMSSSDPNEVSLTIKGLVIGLLPVIIYALKLNGFNLDQIAVGNFVDFLFTIVAEAVIFAGMLRKLVEMGKEFTKPKSKTVG